LFSYINHLELFNPATFLSGRPLRENHPIFILFNQLLPNCLVNIFKKYRITSKKSMPFLFTTLADFYKHLHVNIWKTRSVHSKNYKRINLLKIITIPLSPATLHRHLAVMINDDEDLAQDDLSLTSPH